MGELYRQFIERDDLTIDKWHHYFPVYEQYLGPFVGTAPKLLEIGVQAGGSSRLFADWLGAGTHVTGLDIDPRCRNCAEPGRIDIVIGDQASRDVLRRLVADHGPWNIIVDDGGHTDRQVLTSFEELFPLSRRQRHLPASRTRTRTGWSPRTATIRKSSEACSISSAQLFTEMHRGTASLMRCAIAGTRPPNCAPDAPSCPCSPPTVAAVHLFDSHDRHREAETRRTVLGMAQGRGATAGASIGPTENTSARRRRRFSSSQPLGYDLGIDEVLTPWARNGPATSESSS